MMPAAAQAQTAAPAKPGTPPKVRASTPTPAAAEKAGAPTAAEKEATLNAEAKKARDDSERRMKERDRKLERALKTICTGC